MSLYHRIRNPQLPWGYWLQRSGNVFVDEGGREWSSVRDAFWHGRLGMRPNAHPYVAERIVDEELERLTAVLAAYDRRILDVRESGVDLFGGAFDFQRFHQAWIESYGFLSNDKLTPEGRAVLLMLVATRPTNLGPLPVGSAAMRAIVDGDREDGADRRRWFAEIEAHVRHLPFRFQIAEINARHCIELVGEALGNRMPTRRIVWAQSFGDERARDDLFAWLCERLDRWDAWGRFAWERGADEFSKKMIELLTTGAL